MLTPEQAKELLNSISHNGYADIETAKSINVIADKEQSIKLLNKSSGVARFHTHIKKRFELIVNSINTLQSFNPFQIRCCLCGEVISYPCWYYVEKYSVNMIHYFVCFDRSDVKSVTAKCFRR